MHASWKLTAEKLYFDPEHLLAPDLNLKFVQILLSISTNKNLLFKKRDSANAYLHGYIDVSIKIHQHTNASGTFAYTGHYGLLQWSLNGVSQASRN